jgi:ABC-type molybdate transport system substrate-binding protein
MDLSLEDYADQYKKAKVELAGATPADFRVVAGDLIFYAVTIPETAAHKKAAINYLKVMLGPAGQQAFEKNSQKQMSPCVASDKAKAPAELASFCR